jgi:16S rRNA (guanine1516-N2)-methyltransferase
MAKIAVFPTHPTMQTQAKEFAARLKIPLAGEGQESRYDYLLLVTPHYLGLQKVGVKASPLSIDFLTGKAFYRHQHTSLKNEILARALGLKGGTQPKIVDATGGLAQDAFILASLGFKVRILERSPIIHALVSDAMQRAKASTEVATTIDRLCLIQANAIDWLSTLSTEDKPEIIYLDPMFPERKKSALPRREMMILHEVVGEDIDGGELLQAALACATKRVVVKRPRLAEALPATTAPSFALKGSSSRFDIYLI